MTLKFVDVLPGKPHNGQFLHGAGPELQAHPSRWAEVGEYKSRNSATNCATLYKSRHGAKGYEFASRTVDGRFVVFARYVGTGNDA